MFCLKLKNHLINEFLKLLMYRELVYQPKHTLCALVGMWIHTPLRREGNYLVRYFEVYWGMLPWMNYNRIYIFGGPVQRIPANEVAELQDFFDTSEHKLVWEAPHQSYIYFGEDPPNTYLAG